MEISETNKQDVSSAFDASPADIDVLDDLFKGRYHFLKKLGKGAQGHVFLAEDATTHKLVAVKQLRIQSVKDWKAYDLFHREADTLKRLDIPGIAKFYGVEEFLNIPEPRACIIQEYIDGDALQSFISKGHRFSMAQIGDLLLQLLDIVEKLHHSNPPVIHRDIKPSNILLNYTTDGDSLQVHLIDFGAVSNPQVKSGGSTVVGTYGYMAPEQLMGHAGAASDIYSIGIVAVYLLSGTPPEAIDTQDFLMLIDPYLEHLPHQVTSFLRTMLAPKIENRMTDYDTIRKFFTALKKEQFDEIPNTSARLATKNAYSLTKVTDYLQPGNIDLWQSLSDKTPRRLSWDVRRQLRHCRVEKGYNAVAGRAKVSNLAWIESCLFIGLPVAIASFFGAGFLMPEAYRTAIETYLDETFIFDYHVSYVIFLTLVALLMACIVVFCFKLFKTMKRAKSWKAFIREARKSMATVVRVEYIERPLMSPNALFTPTWEITYSFNPPDDASPDALLRTIQTHRFPKYLKEGSLIPILYRIECDASGEHVTSVPFPLPADEYMNDAISEK